MLISFFFLFAGMLQVFKNADEHFLLEGFETLLHLHPTNNGLGKRDDGIKAGILDLVCRCNILLLTLVKLP